MAGHKRTVETRSWSHGIYLECIRRHRIHMPVWCEHADSVMSDAPEEDWEAFKRWVDDWVRYAMNVKTRGYGEAK